MRHRPVRTCCGCGRRDTQDVLLRVGLREGELAADPQRRLGGRGAYLHMRRACWEAFAARKGAVRSLRRSVPRETRVRLVAALAQQYSTGGTG